MQTESMEWVCNNCGGSGKVVCPADKMEESMLILCSNCSTPSAYGWCAKNGVGDEIEGIEFSTFQRTWSCKYCGSKHKLSKKFYDTPVTFSPSHFKNLKQLKLAKEMRDQKYIPAWAGNMFELWEKKGRYYHARAMFAVVILFTLVFASFLIVDRLHIAGPELSLDMLFISIGVLGLLMLTFLLNPLVEIFFSIIKNIFLIVYKLRGIQG